MRNRDKEDLKDMGKGFLNCLGCLGVLVVLYVLGVFYYQMLIPELLTRHIVEPGTVLVILKWIPIALFGIFLYCNK